MIESGFVILIALAGGIAVGSGYVAFLAVLGIIPRLAQLTRSGKHIQYFEWAVIAGTLTGAWCSLKKHYISNVAILACYIRNILWHIHWNARCGINRSVKCFTYFSETSRGRGEDCCFTHCSCTWKSNRLVVSLDLFRKVGGNI